MFYVILLKTRCTKQLGKFTISQYLQMLQGTSPRVNALDRVKPTYKKRSNNISVTAELDELVKSLFLDGKGPQEEPRSVWDEAQDEALLQWAMTGEEPQLTAPEVEVDLSDEE